ncbi:MAG: PLP-dependent cysteine synthase family protein [Myxococcales bacterium]|nr:PLP-dependent cysteine synthase family protein [Myxococcales bacterium]
MTVWAGRRGLGLVRTRPLDSVVEAVGKTPLVRLEKVGRDAPGVELYLKLELMNPGGSVKDRAASRMMLRALEEGKLAPGKTLIDSTSGNTGVAYSLFGAALGVSVTLVMPSNVSKARKDIARAFGTEVVFSDPMEGSDGAIRLAREIVSKDPDRFFYPDQYSNPDNPDAHYHGTGAEILDALGDRVTHFVAGIGTSGTIMGTSRRLREHPRPIRCIAVEPEDAFHGLEGLKHLPSSLVPKIHDSAGYDETFRVATEAGWEMSERLSVEEGLFVGHSSGANVYAALEIAKRLSREGRGGCVVTIACDRGDRYFEPIKWEKRYVW